MVAGAGFFLLSRNNKIKPLIHNQSSKKKKYYKGDCCSLLTIDKNNPSPFCKKTNCSHALCQNRISDQK